MEYISVADTAGIVERREAISGALLVWFAANRRDLPWRATRDPYHIWLSEIMLQQTTVKTVIPYYHAFLERFPTVRALAEAPVEDVLTRWSGLGYYSRARNLHRAASMVVTDHGGRLPADPVRLRALPGIGEYTVGAILSIAFDISHPLVDGNVVRVLSRLAGWKGDPKSGPLQRQVKELAAALVPARCAGDHNQALMEIGATVCAPADPRCPSCPLLPWCRAAASGEPATYPGVARRPPTVTRELAALHATDGASLLLVRRSGTTVMKDMLELPLLEPKGGELPDLAAALARTGLDGSAGGDETTVTHTIMNQRFRVKVLRANVPSPGKGEGQWVRLADLPGLPLTGLSLKILRKLGTLASRRG